MTQAHEIAETFLKAIVNSNWDRGSAMTQAHDGLSIAEHVLRDVCETEPADPDLMDTICIDTSTLQEIIERRLSGESMLEWAIGRWQAEVANRPLINIHRRALDDTWRQVIRHFGGDPASLLGPNHSQLLVLSGEPK